MKQEPHINLDFFFFPFYYQVRKQSPREATGPYPFHKVIYSPYVAVAIEVRTIAHPACKGEFSTKPSILQLSRGYTKKKKSTLQYIFSAQDREVY